MYFASTVDSRFTDVFGQHVKLQSKFFAKSTGPVLSTGSLLPSLNRESTEYVSKSLFLGSSISNLMLGNRYRASPNDSSNCFIAFFQVDLMIHSFMHHADLSDHKCVLL